MKNNPLQRIAAYFDSISVEAANSGTYAAFRLHPNSAKALVGWAKRNGLTNIEPIDELHITTVYSQKSLDKYQPLGILKKPLKVEFQDFKLFGENEDTLVLWVENPVLHERFKTAKKLGMKWDFPSYVPHITISKEHPLTANDLKQLTPINFPIYLIEEYKEPLSDEYAEHKAAIVEDIIHANATMVKILDDGTVSLNGQSIGHVELENTDIATKIIDLNLRPEYRNQGFGTNVMKQLFERAIDSNKPIVTSTDQVLMEDNKRQRIFLERLGFVKNQGPDAIRESSRYAEEYVWRPTAAIEGDKLHCKDKGREELYFIQPDGSYKKGGDSRSKGLVKEELPEDAIIARMSKYLRKQK